MTQPRCLRVLTVGFASPILICRRPGVGSEVNIPNQDTVIFKPGHQPRSRPVPVPNCLQITAAVDVAGLESWKRCSSNTKRSCNERGRQLRRPRNDVLGETNPLSHDTSCRGRPLLPVP